MRIAHLSDTHTRESFFSVPNCDLFVHSGDVGSNGNIDDLKNFCLWAANQIENCKCKLAVMIAGNHDFCFENGRARQAKKMVEDAGFVYLNDSHVMFEGKKIWGMPVTPWFNDWAFNRYPGPFMKKHTDQIPSDVDILVSHGPTRGVLDKTINDEYVGCKDLRDRIASIMGNRKNPLLHLFGHIHEARGYLVENNVYHVNGSSLDRRYSPSHSPVIIEWVGDKISIHCSEYDL